MKENASQIILFRQAIDENVLTRREQALFMEGDSEAQTIQVDLYEDKNYTREFDASGLSAILYMTRQDGKTVILSDDHVTIAGNSVSIKLDATCYAIPGAYCAFVRVVDSSNLKKTIARFCGSITANQTGEIIDPGNVIPNIDDLIAQIDAMEAATAASLAQYEAVETAEASRVSAEESREAAESAREAAEESRESAESARVAAEAKREGHESTRVLNEDRRRTAENVRDGYETNRQNAETERENAETARRDAETARAEAETQRAAAEEARDAAEQARQETFDTYEERLVAATPDDTTVDGRAWTSKKTVDSLCLPFEATGNPVQVYPVEGYPLGVRVSWEPVQAGEGDPSPDNIRRITGRDSVSITIGNGMDSKTTAIPMPETVYGGTLDVWTGVVTVHEKYFVLTGEERVRETGSESRKYIDITKKDVKGKTSFVCSHYRVSTTTEKNTIYFVDGSVISVTDEAHASTPTDLKTYLSGQYAAGTPVQICYTLATPYTIQLGKNQIAALSGVNSLYTDAGTLTVTGREDPRHTFVTLTDRVAALESAAAGV